MKGALDILLGPPLRVSGSHHVYRTRQGGTYPIPLHGTDEVGTGILNKCLREFGITPAELRGCL
ncbi:type II toxin-antitoxin system HicA family toxin [Candidatus Peregrinibacteria bacterium]|nr:type II toxin-antitoxin system HicA family toxin [Candidatus Peregrinibacteria bacterium]